MKIRNLHAIGLAFALATGASFAAQAQSNNATSPDNKGSATSQTDSGGSGAAGSTGMSGSMGMSGSAGASSGGAAGAGGDAAEHLPGHQPTSKAGENPSAENLRGHSETPGKLKDR